MSSLRRPALGPIVGTRPLPPAVCGSEELTLPTASPALPPIAGRLELSRS